MLLATKDACGLAVQPSSTTKSQNSDISSPQDATVLSTPPTTTRIGFIKQLTYVPLAAVAVAASSGVAPANASGGATAGGAYLLSAKQRYNERVKGSVKGLLAAGEGLAAGDSKAAKAYFASEESGGWKDLTAAGYLLSNAFRRSSTTPPDSLPAVKVRDDRKSVIFLL